MSTPEDLAKEVEALREENRKACRELFEARQEIAALKKEYNKVSSWVDVLIRQLPGAIKP